MKFACYMLLLFCLSCQNKQLYTLSGRVVAGEGVAHYTLACQGVDTNFVVEPDSAGNFSFTLPVAEGVPFAKLLGVVEGESQWQYMMPVCLQEGGQVQVGLELDARGAVLRAEDKENRALEAFRRYALEQSRKLWMETPAPEQAKSRLAGLPEEAARINAEMRPGKRVEEYLMTWATIEVLDAAASLSFLYRQQGGQALPEDALPSLPDLPEVLDKPYLPLFYGGEAHVMAYLREQGGEPEGQMRLLQERFREPALRERVARAIVERFADGMPYSEENLKRLEALGSGLADREALVQKFRDKRYATVGAPVPDVAFKDKEGNARRLSEFAGKYIYIDLWASWCGPCVAEVPHLQQLEKSLKNKEVVFVSISLDTKREAWLQKMEQLGMHGNQWIVEDETFADMLNVKGIPHFLLYGKDGKLLEYKSPRPSHPALKEKLEGL